MSDKLRQTLIQMDGLNVQQTKKCVHCMLVENLYPDKIAPALYEDSGLSSGTLEEVTLTEGVSRRAAVKTILKKLVKYQKERGPGMDYVDALAKALPESYKYLMPYLGGASTGDLMKCSCVRDNSNPARELLKVKPKSHRSQDFSHSSQPQQRRTEKQEFRFTVTNKCDLEMHNNKTYKIQLTHCKDIRDENEEYEFRIGASSQVCRDVSMSLLHVTEDPLQHEPSYSIQDSHNHGKLFQGHEKKTKGHRRTVLHGVTRQDMMIYVAAPKSTVLGSDCDEFQKIRETVKEESPCYTEEAVARCHDEYQGHNIWKHLPPQNDPLDVPEFLHRRGLQGQDHTKGHQGTVVDQGKGHKMMQYVACPKTARIGSDWEEFHQVREIAITDEIPASSYVSQNHKCIHCMLMENLYPDKIAASLYEDSGLSSGTLDEVTLTEGVSRRAAVKTILKKLVKHQKGKGSGREGVDALGKALAESYDYLMPHLESSSITDLQKCACTGRHAKERANQKFKLECQKVETEAQKTDLLRSPGFVELGPEKEYMRLLAASRVMHLLTDNAQWKEFQTYRKLLIAKFADSVDMKIYMLHHMVDAHLTTNRISNQTYQILKESKQLIPQAKFRQFMEISQIFTWAKVLIKERKYGSAEEQTDNFYQQSQLHFVQHMMMCQKRRDAVILIHQFQNKFATNSVPESILQTIEDWHLCSLHHGTNFQEFLRKSETTTKYSDDCYVSGKLCLIQLAQFHLRCCVTFKGTSESFNVDNGSITKAERCLQKVLEKWEGIPSRTEGKYLLAMSDLHLRKKQYHEALEFANEALELCTTRNQPHMVEWAERRIVYLERQIGVNGVDVDRSDVSSGCEAGPSSGAESG